MCDVEVNSTGVLMLELMLGLARVSKDELSSCYARNFLPRLLTDRGRQLLEPAPISMDTKDNASRGGALDILTFEFYAICYCITAVARLQCWARDC